MMENETVVYGASDDLIVVAGNNREELYAEYGEPTYFRVGDWKFKGIYNPDGEWLFEVVDQPEGLQFTQYGVGEHDRYKDYSEVIAFPCPNGVAVEKVNQ